MTPVEITPWHWAGFIVCVLFLLALDLGAEFGVDLPMARLALGSFAAGLGLPPGEQEPSAPGASRPRREEPGR